MNIIFTTYIVVTSGGWEIEYIGGGQTNWSQTRQKQHYTQFSIPVAFIEMLSNAKPAAKMLMNVATFIPFAYLKKRYFRSPLIEKVRIRADTLKQQTGEAIKGITYTTSS